MFARRNRPSAGPREVIQAQPVGRGNHGSSTEPVSSDDVMRAAREMVDAYGPAAGGLMRERMRAVLRRGDAEVATLWHAIARAVDHQLGARGATE